MKETFSNFIDNFYTNCSKVQKKAFKKNEVITNYIVNRNQICIILSGTADLIRSDYNGNNTIIEHYTKYDTFGEVFYNINTNSDLSVIAKENCEVLFFMYENCNQKCKKNCKFHYELISNLPNILLDKIVTLNLRIELLGKRTIRDKLLSYFNILSTHSHSKTFKLPMSLTDLADYLSVDRSAMMREIKTMKNENVILKKRFIYNFKK